MVRRVLCPLGGRGLIVKVVATITLLMLGSAALAQAENTAWIKACGTLENSNFGTSVCDVNEMADLLQTLDAAYINALDSGMDGQALSDGFRVLGRALALPEVQQGKCSDAGYSLIMVAGEFLNSIAPPDNATDAQMAMALSLADVLDAGAGYVMRGCR